MWVSAGGLSSICCHFLQWGSVGPWDEDHGGAFECYGRPLPRFAKARWMICRSCAGLHRFSTPACPYVERGVQRSSLPMPSRRSEEHTSELQSLMRISYAVFCLKKKITKHTQTRTKQLKRLKYHRTTNINKCNI